MKNPPFAVGGPDTSKNLVNYLQTSASWARIYGKRKVIWNGLDGSSERSLHGNLQSLVNISAAAVAEEKA